MRFITGFTGLVKSRVWVPQLARQGLGGKATNTGVGGKIGLGGKATRANPGPTDRVVLVGIGSARAANTKTSILNFILPPQAFESNETSPSGGSNWPATGSWM